MYCIVFLTSSIQHFIASTNKQFMDHWYIHISGSWPLGSTHNSQRSRCCCTIGDSKINAYCLTWEQTRRTRHTRLGEGGASMQCVASPKVSCIVSTNACHDALAVGTTKHIPLTFDLTYLPTHRPAHHIPHHHILIKSHLQSHHNQYLFATTSR